MGSGYGILRAVLLDLGNVYNVDTNDDLVATVEK